jgi:hypothetical protein
MPHCIYHGQNASGLAVVFGRLISVFILLTPAAGCKDGALAKAIDGSGAAKFLGLQKDEPPVFRTVAALELKPDETISIPLSLDRRGSEGPIGLSLEGLPSGLEGTVRELAAGSSSTEITLRADQSLGDEDLEATCTVTATVGKHTARTQFPIQVPRVPRPSFFIEQPIVLQPGKEAAVTIPVLRNGWQEEIPLTVGQCPIGIAATVATVPRDEPSARVRVAIDPDMPEGTTSFRLQWISYGRTMTFDAPIFVERVPFAIDSPVAVALRPAESREVAIRMRRSAYQGPVALSLIDLPDGIQASSGEIAAGKEEGTILVIADPTAQASYAVATIEATGGYVTTDGLFVIRIPPDIAASALPPSVMTGLGAVSRPRSGGIESRLTTTAIESLDAFYGTTSDSRQAVTAGLAWLAAAQQEDGTWRSESAAGRRTGDALQPAAREDTRIDADGLVGLAVLPFLAEGIGHEREAVQLPEFMEFAEVTKKALVHLARRQATGPGPSTGRVGDSLPSHILSLTAFSEAYALSGNEKLKRHAKKAVDYLVDQQTSDGGWGEEANMNALDTAQALIALRLARTCRVGVSSLPLRKGEKFLATCFAGQPPNPGPRYSRRPGDLPDAEATAAGLLATLSAQPQPSPEILAGCNFLAAHPPGLRVSHTDHSGLFLLLTTQVLRNVEGERFDRWNAAIRSFLARNQIHHGDLAGSWDPATFADRTDRVSSTALAILCLQSNYRYFPLFRTLDGSNDSGQEGAPDQPPEETGTH